MRMQNFDEWMYGKESFICQRQRDGGRGGYWFHVRRIIM